jgi:hypothetical protein
MLKRTLGRSLLALLLVTGFAGTVDDSSISGKERKAAVTMMKESKSRVLNSTKGLSKAQLEFRPAADKWSIQDCIYHITFTEKALWSLLEATMKSPATPEKRAEVKITDEQFMKRLTDRSHKVKTSENLEPRNTGYASLEAAMEDFKKERSLHIKYMKSTTEDLRNRVVQMPFGTIDCYQLCLMISGHSDRHVLQIEEIRNDPAFPAQ